MAKQIFIEQSKKLTQFAILENNILTEIHAEKTPDSIQEGDIYLGTITKFLLGINSVFVNIGERKNGFLHYSDLNAQVLSLMHFAKGLIQKTPGFYPNLKGFTPKALTAKNGKIANIFSKKDIVPVQILKEPISTKGARLTTEISIPGRFVVFIPFSDRGISISKKILDTRERERLKKSIKPYEKTGFGIIVRTAAQGAKPKDLYEDIEALIDTWRKICDSISHSGGSIQKVHSENQRIISFLRDFLSDHFDQIVVNAKPLFAEIKAYIAKINPEKVSILKLSEHSNLFDHYNITKQIKLAFSAKVPLESGGHLVIQQTEAMHVIDVNSGFKVFSDNQEDNAFENNLLAAKEVARQIQLRDLGGIIVIDFIDMKLAEHRKKIYGFMRDMFAKDKANNKILPLSKFGILQITRQRVRPEVTINTSEACPSCKGTGKIDSHTLIIEDEIQKTLDYLFKIGHKKLSIFLHPIVYAYIVRGGLKSIVNGWRWKYKQWIKVDKQESLQLTKYKIYDKKGDEIQLT